MQKSRPAAAFIEPNPDAGAWRDEREATKPPICAECGDQSKPGNPVQWTAVMWSGDHYFEGHIHRDCQDPLMARVEREWQIKPEDQ